MELRSMFIAILLVSAVFIGESLFFNSWGSSYGKPLDVSSLNQSARLQSAINNIQGNQTSKLTGIPILGNAVATLSGVVEFLLVIQNILFDSWASMIGGVAVYFGLDAWVTVILGALAVFTILIGIVSVIIRWRL